MPVARRASTSCARRASNSSGTLPSDPAREMLALGAGEVFRRIQSLTRCRSVREVGGGTGGRGAEREMGTDEVEGSMKTEVKDGTGGIGSFGGGFGAGNGNPAPDESEVRECFVDGGVRSGVPAPRVGSAGGYEYGEEDELGGVASGARGQLDESAGEVGPPPPPRRRSSARLTRLGRWRGTSSAVPPVRICETASRSMLEDDDPLTSPSSVLVRCRAPRTPDGAGGGRAGGV